MTVKVTNCHEKMFCTLDSWPNFLFISMHVSKKNVPLRELCPKKMSQREENARINTTDGLEQFGHNCGSFN